MSPMSVGYPYRVVNIYLMSYIRYVNCYFLLDGAERFVVKSTFMNSAPSSSSSSNASNLAVADPSGSSPTFSPLYQQIKALIMHSLQSGEWRAGELIPSEGELANRFKG